MQAILTLVILAVSGALAARLDNSYLPPRGGSGSGAGIVSAPFGGASGRYSGAGIGSISGGGRYSGAGIGSLSGGGRYSGGAGTGGAPSGPIIPIISYENNPNQGDGVYSYRYETGNGITAEESGRQSAASGPEGPGTAAQGSYSYTGPDGQTYTVTYTADENGFQAQGAHLPTPPPIPPEILRSLQLQAAGGTAAGGAGSYNQGSSGGYSGSGSFGAGAGAGAGYRQSTQSYNSATGYQYKK